jgi:hypothetical protein
MEMFPAESAGVDLNIDFVKASRNVRVRVSIFGVTGLGMGSCLVKVQASHSHLYVSETGRHSCLLHDK